MCEWLIARGVNPPTRNEVPKIGFIATNFIEPVAMGFLRRVEGGFAQLDGLVTNPKSSSIDRSTCIDEIVTQLVTKAKEKGIKSIMAYSTYESILNRSVKHGFVPIPHSIIALSLIDKEDK